MCDTEECGEGAVVAAEERGALSLITRLMPGPCFIELFAMDS